MFRRTKFGKVAAFRSLLLTGCRLSEIQLPRWGYVKNGCIEVPDRSPSMANHVVAMFSKMFNLADMPFKGLLEL